MVPSATGMPKGKRIRGNTIGIPSQNALPNEVYQSSRREAVCDRRFRAFHMLNIIAKRQNARNPRGVVRRTRVLFGSCAVCRLVHVLVPLRASSRHNDDTGECTENDSRKFIPRGFCHGDPRASVDDVHVEAYGGAYGREIAHINLRFRQVCGKSINEDIQEIRLAEVRRLLGQTNRTILQIGRDCGFNDPDHLKRVFKKRFGTSMRLYRNTYRSSDVRKQPCH